MTMIQEESRSEIHHEEWPVQRHGIIDEVFMGDGTIRYHVKIWDQGREQIPFIKQWFSDEYPAVQFLRKVMGTVGQEIDAQEGKVKKRKG